MSVSFNLLNCVAKALVRNLGKPFGLDIFSSLAEVAWREWDNEKKSDAKVAELQRYAVSNLSVFLDEVRGSIDSVRAELGVQARANFDEHKAVLETYLAQIPDTIQSAWRRPSDPTGTTVPANTSLRSASDLMLYIPDKLPRFRAGDQPVGGYSLVKPLGSGGASEVWLARDIYTPSSKIALKFALEKLQTANNAEPAIGGCKAFEHEVAIVNKLHQANIKTGILRPIKSFLNNNPPCLAYEYVAGGNMAGLIRDLHGLNLSKQEIADRSRRYILQLAQIMAKVHQAMIVHRDLKPTNILVADHDRQLIIGDWGIGGMAAGNTGQTKTKTPNYHAAMVRGSFTPNYASKQQRKGDTPHARDDVYALGVIWYHLLTGELEEGIPPDWREELFSLDIGKEDAEVLGRCIISNVDERFQNAGELVSEISNINSTILKEISPTQVGTTNGISETVNARDIVSSSRTSQEKDRPAPPVFVTHIRPWAYLRSVWAVLWGAFRHPFSTTIIDLSTGNAVHIPTRSAKTEVPSP